MIMRRLYAIEVEERNKHDFVAMSKVDFCWKDWERSRQRSFQSVGTGRQLARQLAHREVMEKKKHCREFGLHAALQLTLDIIVEPPRNPAVQLRHVRT